MPNWAPVASPPIEEKSLLKEQILWETATALGACAVTCVFAATPYVAGCILAISVTLVALNALIGFACAWLKDRGYTITQEMVKAFTATNTGLLYTTTGELVIHELGHAAVIPFLFKTSHLSISTGLFNAVTRWRFHDLTALGHLLGERLCVVITAGMGPLFAVCAATAMLFLALHYAQEHDYLSQCLFASAAFSLMGHARYALSALTANPRSMGHDFVALWKVGGIHPLVSTISILAFPILALGTYYACQGEES